MLAHVARTVAGDARHDAPAIHPDLPTVPDGLATPWLLGQVREALHAPDDRAALGAWFTPPALARRLVAAVDVADPAVVADPACGGGAFLLAAHDRWPGARLVGRDVDPVAIWTARTALSLRGATDVDVAVGDGLDPEGPHADVVVTNPPFRSQLARTTSRSAARRAQLRRWYGEPAAGYADDAALFLLAVARRLSAGGQAVLVVPESTLAATDAAGIRSAVGAGCDVDVVWRDRARTFPGVPTCAVRLSPHADGPPAHTDWAGLLAVDVPAVAPATAVRVGDVATATADFRDAYYLLADHVGEGDPSPSAHRLVTVGLIDPAHLRWGTTPARFAKQRWTRPVVTGLPADFAARRLGPKLLVATQTRVLEAVVDDAGDLLPSTPVVTVRTDRPWHVGAALTSPVATAVAARRHAGAARSRGALRLSAAQLLDLPLPAGPSPAWDAAADAFRAAHTTTGAGDRAALLLRCGDAMCAAYDVGVAGGLLDWWAARLPRR